MSSDHVERLRAHDVHPVPTSVPVQKVVGLLMVIPTLRFSLSMQYSAPPALKDTGVASFFSVCYVPNKQVCCSVILSLSVLDFIPLSREEVGCPLR